MDDCPSVTAIASEVWSIAKSCAGFIAGYWVATRGEKRKLINGLIGTLALMQDELRLLDDSRIEDFHKRCVSELRGSICGLLPEFQEASTTALMAAWHELSEFKEHLFISELEPTAQIGAEIDKLMGESPALTKRQELDRLLNDIKRAALSLRISSIGDF